MADIPIRVMPNYDVGYLDKLLLDKSRRVQPRTSDYFRSIPHVHFQLWCHKLPLYQYPTIELLHWLSIEIAGRTAMEIGAGKSCLGRHLGILMVDNFSQMTPIAQMYYRSLGQVPLQPDDDVMAIDANEAIRQARPQVVVGAWITQKYMEGSEHGNMFGPDEAAILDAGCTYIHIGNDRVHQAKRIGLRPHRELRFPWLVSRANYPEENCIWIWDA